VKADTEVALTVKKLALMVILSFSPFVPACALTPEPSGEPAAEAQEAQEPSGERVGEAQQPGSVAYCSVVLAACVAGCRIQPNEQARAFCHTVICQAVYRGCLKLPEPNEVAESE
jgi:hypothetical protein